MERKINEIFRYKKERLQVKSDSCGCFNCYFAGDNCIVLRGELGECSSENRKDGKNVIFKKMQEEREIGEKFRYGNKQLQVKESCSCYGCYFNNNGCLESQDERGECLSEEREDGKSVIFIVTSEDGYEGLKAKEEYAIGEVVEHCGNKYEVVDCFSNGNLVGGCVECAFMDDDCDGFAACSSITRKDRKDIFYRKLEPENDGKKDW